MSTGFSKRMQKLGTRLLSKYGSSVSLSRAGSKVWDSVLGEYVIQPSTIIPLPAAIAIPYNSNLVDGTTIQAGDLRVVMDFSVEPKPADKIVFDGATWSIISIGKPIITDDKIVYFVQVRK